MPGVWEVIDLTPIMDSDLPLCHSHDMLMISHLSHYYFPLMTAMSIFLSEQKPLIYFKFLNKMRKINAPLLCNNKYSSKCFF